MTVVTKAHHKRGTMNISFKKSVFIPAVNKVNVEFQATSFRVHKLCSSINSSVKATLINFLKKEAVKDKDLNKINPNDPSNYLELEDIYRGARVKSIGMENSSNILRKDIDEFHVKTLNFYVTLYKQMFPFPVFWDV